MGDAKIIPLSTGINSAHTAAVGPLGGCMTINPSTWPTYTAPGPNSQQWPGMPAKPLDLSALFPNVPTDTADQILAKAKARADALRRDLAEVDAKRAELARLDAMIAALSK